MIFYPLRIFSPFWPTKDASKIVPSINSAASAYHPAIDGLRAISVSLVVLYHAGLNAFPGGYIGVDVFFVISGFLIITQIADAKSRGTFSLSEFWARRTLRILPPLFATLAGVLVASYFLIIVAEEAYQLGRQVSTSALMVINIRLMKQDGYFDTAAETKPLLNMWSLAVEEQFYAIAPLFIIALFFLRHYFSKSFITAIVALAFLISLGLAIYMSNTPTGESRAFYLMPLRAWEFIAGGAIGFLLPRLVAIRGNVLDLIALVGLSAIMASAIFYDTHSTYPSWRAIVPAVGASLAILSFALHPSGVLATVLSSRPMVALGLVSYSLYLWHWPVLVFAAELDYDSSIPLRNALAVALSLILAVATFKLIEQPIKNWRRGRTLGWKIILAGVVASVAFALAGYLSPKVGDRTDIAASRPADAGYASKNACHVWHDIDACLSNAKSSTGLLIGDSHAMAMARSLRVAAEGRTSTLIEAWENTCSPNLGMYATVPHCLRISDSLANWLNDDRVKPSYAVVLGRWRYYVDQQRRLSGNNAKAEFVTSLRRRLEQLGDNQVERIAVIAPIPEFRASPDTCLFKSARRNFEVDTACYVGRTKFETDRSTALSWIMEAIEGNSHVRLIDPIDVFCDDEWCRAVKDDVMLYHDDDHLNALGAAAVIQSSDVFEWLFDSGAEQQPQTVLK